MLSVLSGLGFLVTPCGWLLITRQFLALLTPIVVVISYGAASHVCLIFLLLSFFLWVLLISLLIFCLTRPSGWVWFLGILALLFLPHSGRLPMRAILESKKHSCDHGAWAFKQHYRE